MFTVAQFLRVVYAFEKAHLRGRLYTVDSQKRLTHTVTHTRKRADGSSGNMGAEEYFISSRND